VKGFGAEEPPGVLTVSATFPGLTQGTLTLIVLLSQR